MSASFLPRVTGLGEYILKVSMAGQPLGGRRLQPTVCVCFGRWMPDSVGGGGWMLKRKPLFSNIDLLLAYFLCLDLDCLFLLTP